MPLMASSTTAPTAMARPASTIELNVWPRRCKTRAAATSETTTVATLTSAARQW